MSGLPYLAMSITLLGAGQLADYLRSRQILSTTAVNDRKRSEKNNQRFDFVLQVRKIFNCSAFLAQTVFMVLAAYLTTPAGIIVCLVIAVGMGGFAWTGFA